VETQENARLRRFIGVGFDLKSHCVVERGGRGVGWHVESGRDIKRGQERRLSVVRFRFGDVG
jgi:hypothetical protein